jgi:hypothetical protein
MNVRICDALPSVGERFAYQYDFGSTTTLELKVIGHRAGRLGRSATKLVARNTAPLWPCAICGKPAIVVCSSCWQVEGNPFVCARHRRQHGCGEDEGLLPVVNSPRMGVCGYVGDE